MTKREAYVQALLISSTLIHRVIDQDSDQFEGKILDAMKQIHESLRARANNLIIK